MNRTTIDYGIDLGTTNSAIAVLIGIEPRIVKNNDDQDVTPSSVGYGKGGQLFVGTRARNMIIDKPRDAYIEFKRRMGTEYAYVFSASGLAKKPEDLSSEILKALRADVARSPLAEDIEAAVITVPAAFELHQCDATRRAAELAGFRSSPLLQEPVAAALAYGFQVDTDKAYWLVYDFGGGTFDSAIIKAEEGIINVVHHGGDNFLGGTDIDWAIVEKVVIPQLIKNHDLPGLKRGNERWQRALLKLKRSVELAKIELTTKESTTLMDCVFDDASGHDIDCEEISLNRNQITTIAEPIIQRSVATCKKILREKKLPASAVEKVILVGGPTKAPYFRELLASSLGIPIDFTMDPLTVVAKGAAIFAGTQRIDPSILKQSNNAEYRIEMLNSNKSVGHEVDPLVGGKVLDQATKPAEGFTVEFINSATQWRSGKVTLGQDGTFLLNVLAEKGQRNVFTIELQDAAGKSHKAVPDQYVYTVGAVVEEQPLINSMGVGLATNDVEWFFRKGAGLPQKKKSSTPFHTAYAVKRGEQGNVISIPVLEGENERADRNRLVGKLDITSEMIKRDLAAGTEVELTLKISESRIITVNAYVPILDEEFEERLELRKVRIDANQIEADFAKELERLDELIKKATDANDAESIAMLEKTKASELLGEIKSAVSAAKGDPDAAEKADKRLLELKLRLDAAEDRIAWPSMVAKINEWLSDTQNLVTEYGNTKQKERVKTLATEIEQIIAAKETQRLSRRQKQVEELYYAVLFSIDAFWVNQFQRLEGERSKMTDKVEADRLVDMGQNYLQQNNVAGLRNVVRRMWNLLPKDVVQGVQRGFFSGLTR
jgi:molecular chaperone DnaK